MSYSWSSPVARGLPPLSFQHNPRSLPCIQACTAKTSKVCNFSSRKPPSFFAPRGRASSSLAIQIGALLASVEQPVFAVTGENNYEVDLTWILIQSGIVATWYFLVMPPIIMNWLRLRWYDRKFLEMYLQFMCVFLFFPGLLLWAPFVNFRRLPRDPNMKYPWSTPQDRK